MYVGWHTKTAEDALKTLGTQSSGLGAKDAARRLEESGPNILPAAKVDTLPVIFLRQFASPLIYILLAAAAIVFYTGETVDAAIILAILVFNAVVGTIQEGKAQNTLQALRQYVETNATVVRDDLEIIIPDREVVPGDVLVVSEGEKIAADARLLESADLLVDQAALTGESEPVLKDSGVVEDAKAQAAEQRNMIFRGTYALHGSGRAVVTETASSTVIGRIAEQISRIDTDVPLKANIKYLSRAIIGAVAGIGLILLVLGIIQGQPLTVMFATIVSLSVSVIPEGLPIVMTLVLASGVWRMSKRNALVKKLQAVEALGQANVIAVDKTGTITKNELVVRKLWSGEYFDVTGVGYEPRGEVQLESGGPNTSPIVALAARIATFCSDAHVSYSEALALWRVSGDPTEAALGVFGKKVADRERVLAEAPRIAEIPFDYARKYHASLHRDRPHNFLAVVGAPEAILGRSTKIEKSGAAHPLTKKDREELEAVFSELSRKGIRVLAGAYRACEHDTLEDRDVHSLTFVAYFGLQDALRTEVKDATARAREAGMRVVMITGDHQLTATAIASEAGIYQEGDTVLSGSEVDALSDDELAARLERTSVFARVTPDHKLRIINAYKKRGDIIAMTGDGVNDAPSLVAANLGVAMGKIGTEVAKEAADIVLLDDNFGSIVSAVEEGRNIYKTIKKVMLYLFSTSLGEVLVIGGALFLGYPLPILAAQIIWLNFVTDGFLDVALAMEPKERGLLAGRFEKPKKLIVDALMAQRMLVMSIPMMLGTLYLFAGSFEENLPKAITISLTTMAAFQWFNAWNCRHESESIFTMDLLSNKYLIGATTIVVSLHLFAVYHPVGQAFLHTVPLTLAEWLVIIPVAATIILAEEVRKFFVRTSVKAA